MSEEYLIAHGAPTLSGIKTGNLFPCCFASDEEMKKDVRSVNRIIGRKGVCLIPMRKKNGQVLMYLYRPDRLRLDLAAPEAADILKQKGYKSCAGSLCLSELRRRLNESGEFPHEIGLFLGYPPEDVRGFIEHGGKDCKCVGTWKVYGDAGRAERLFASYKTCTEKCLALKAKGASVDSLTAAD